MNLRFFEELEPCKTILLAGAGGGFDIFAGLPLYFALQKAGKKVHLANLSFSMIYASTGRRIGPPLIEIDAQTVAHTRYFPELYLTRWFQSRGDSIPIYCFDRTGAQPIMEGYKALADHLQPDAIVLIDGGTDSLMRGDEAGLGTPEEDVASIAAVQALSVPKKLLACIGFGIDTFHGVCHAQFLEAVADLTKKGAFLGAWTLMNDTEEAALYKQACDYVFARMSNHPSIVNASILSAMEGEFGDYHASHRTEGSELFINPLMTLYWAFELDAVATRILYLDRIRETKSHFELRLAIEQFRDGLEARKPWVTLPM